MIDHGEGAAGEKHGQCEEEVQLRVRVQNSADEVVVRARPEKVDLTGHRGLAELPEEMRRCAVRVRELAVASSALETLPEWLGELARLEVLRLGHATCEEERVTGYRMERKQEGCDRLTALPDGIQVLTALKTLDLSGCTALTGLPEGLSALTALQTLDLSGCDGLTGLPEGLSALTALQTLNLAVCGSLRGEGLSALTALQTLGLTWFTLLTALPEWLLSLTALSTLCLSLRREQTYLPEGLSALTALQTLDLSFCYVLRGLPQGLSALTALQTLNLSSCIRLTKLPEGLSALTALQTLKLEGCSGLTGLPEGLSALTALQTLHLFCCSRLTGLPDGLSALTALQTLNLRRCTGLTGLPEGLSALTALQTLHLAWCSGLTGLPEGLSALTALQTLNLSSCSRLQELPPSLADLTALTELDLEYCPALHTPPSHVVRAGLAAVQQFLRDLRKGFAPCHLVKVVLLGDQRAGKSSLADSLKSGKPVLRKEDDRTVGIDLVRWRLDPASEVVSYIYDAAGQRVYRATHPLFMSREALFLHVVRSVNADGTIVSEGKAAVAVLEWVEAVQQEAPGAVMGVVWTHDDALDASDSRRLHEAVLSRVNAEIERHVDAVDEAMRAAEADMEDDAAWREKKALRDAALDALDKVVMERDEKKVLRDDALHKVVMMREYEAFLQRESEEEEEESEAGEGESEEMNRLKKLMQAYYARQSHWFQRMLERGMLERAFESAPGWRLKDSSLKRLQELTAQVTSLHHAMQDLEKQRSRHDGEQQSLEDSKMRLERLRRQRVLRPRILLNYAVSSKTGRGLEQLRRALSELMQNEVMFPHVGMKVPLNYAMLERLAQEGRGRVDAEAKPERAAWESAVTKHVEAKASDALRRLCAQPHVTLSELETEAGKVGMDREELRSALAFLHTTGSVLYYELQHTVLVFMQPQFIIDAIKYVIRESSADNVNEEIRVMDACIRRRSAHGGAALDKFLGCGEGHGSGVLPRQLLTRHLWRDFKARDHEVLLQLMKAFKLLRPLPLAEAETFLVPAMLPRSQLPPEYTEPQWWCPSKASGAAALRADMPARAEIRIVYEVLGGSLPFGFMSKLQVSLVALAQSESVEEERTSASETAVVDRICGTVLSEAYACGGGKVREWIVLSRPPMLHTGHDASSGVITEPVTDCIRIMGWIELHSAEGATDWRLLTRAMWEIQKMEQRAPELCLRKKTFYVDAHSKLSNALEIPRQERLLLRFTFVDGGQNRQTEVKRERVLPSGSWKELKLVQAQQVCVSDSTFNRVDAFFAKRASDHGIDVHAEGQMMTRIVMDPGCGWDCRVHPQPTIEDLYKSIELARQFNMHVLHLAGHARKECGFIWNANDEATASKTFDVEAISLAIGAVAGQQGPLECVVLNACCTVNMGRLLRQRGVPNVLCWQTQVQDETARELCERFFRPLVEDRAGKSTGKRDYRRAFFAATDAMRSSAHTRGAAHLPRGADALAVGDLLARSTTTRNASPTNSSMLLEDGVSTAEEEEHSASSRGSPQRPWHMEDVVLFLSNDGDSEPIYLWRERPGASAPLPASADAGHTVTVKEGGHTFEVEETVDAGLKQVFEQYGLGAVCIDVCRELGVTSLYDLENHVTAQDVDDLPKYVKETLKPAHRSKLKALIEGQVSAPALVACSTRESGAAVAPSAGRIYAFFVKHSKDSIDVHGEAENVMEDLRTSPWWKHFELDIFVMPTFDKFRDLIRNCTSQNVVLVCFSGHAGEGGELCFVKDRDTMEMLKPDFVAPHIAGASKGASTRPEGGTIECVLLNGCYTRPLGVVLREKGVLHVVCWRLAVKDSIAKTFAEEFFKELVVSPTDYKGAFEKGRIQVERCDPQAACSLCFFSETFSVDMQDDAKSSSDDDETYAGHGSGPHERANDGRLKTGKDKQGNEEERLRRKRAEAEQQEKERIRREKEEAKLKAREEKERIMTEKAAAAKKVAEELAVVAAKAAKAAEEAAASSSSESDDDEDEMEAGARDGDGDTEACRMANNAKGRSEMKGFKELGFTLVFNDKDIERGVELYEKGGLDRKSVKEYGLEESDKDLWRGRTKVAGKKLLYIHKEALRKVFGDTSMHTYQDLWKVGGVVERAARRADSIARSSALQHLRASLSVRKGQAQDSGHADTGHQQMRDEMEECIGRIEVMVREDRQKQSLKEGKARSASLGSNTSQKPKGQNMANGFSLLGTGDDGGSEQEDE